MAHRSHTRLSRTVPTVVCLLVALVGFATAADGQTSKDLRLAFVNGFSTPQEVFTVDPGKGNGNSAKGNGPPEQITHVDEVLQLRWSPAGNLFAIQTIPFGTIVVMEPDGSHPQVVATDAALGEFSPDGRRLALV